MAAAGAETPTDRITLSTRFGEFEADSRNLLSFPAGLPGFEQCHRFVLLASIEAAPLQVLMSVDGPPASFLAIEPRIVLPTYRCVLSASDRQRLAVAESDTVLWLSLLTVNDEGAAFANLRAPVVINPGKMLGCQVIRENDQYPVQFVISLG